MSQKYMSLDELVQAHPEDFRNPPVSNKEFNRTMEISHAKAQRECPDFYEQLEKQLAQPEGDDDDSPED